MLGVVIPDSSSFSGEMMCLSPVSSILAAREVKFKEVAGLKKQWGLFALIGRKKKQTRLVNGRKAQDVVVNWCQSATKR